MDCQLYREVLSADLDGEAAAGERAAAAEHLAGCASCRAFRDGAARLGRPSRVGPADPLPDLTDAVLAALGVTAPEPEPVSTAVPVLSCLSGGCCGDEPAATGADAPRTACGCLQTCGCGCQQGAPCRCAVRAA
ncbi:zf-HC2 domain-containing protein [Pseudonocardia spirodelae]|uniref:Zf-HC2 domain-containing protein n=1 Tax=Pseudonocardia spirodelae TaxID=3133431 RepID=A0ABU8T7M3_9PSEU